MANKFEAQDFLIRNSIRAGDIDIFDTINDFFDFIRKDSVFLEQLQVASPLVYQSLLKYYQNKLTQDKQISQLFISTYKYYKRSMNRATPFGLFSETSIGKFASKSSLSLENSSYKSIKPDSNWYMKFIDMLEMDNYPILSFKVNRAVYINGNRAVQLYSLKKNEEEVSIKNTKAYELIVSLCSDSFISFDNLHSTLMQKYGVEKKEIVTNYIIELIKNNYLLSELRFKNKENNDWDFLLATVSKLGCNELLKALKQIVYLVSRYEKSDVGEGNEILSNICAKMCDICYSSNYVQVDLFNKSQITLDDQYKNTLEECAQFIEKVNMDDKKLYIDHYKDKFLEKYGLNQEVPIIEMMDSNFGIGAPFDYTHPKNEIIETEPKVKYYSDNLEKVLLDLYVYAVRTDTNIDLQKLEGLFLKENKKYEVGGMELFFSVTKTLETDTVQFHLSNLVGTSNLGASSGRFSQFSQSFNEYHQKMVNYCNNWNNNQGIVTCEIEFMPETFRDCNVMRNNTVRNYTLSLFLNSSKNEIKLDNIYIGIGEGGKFYAREKLTGELIKFYVTNMYNRMLFCNEVRFLCDISEDYFGNIPWDLVYAKFNFVPRLCYRNIVISPKTWKIYKNELNEITDKNICSYLKSKNIPHKFNVVNIDNKINIDLTKHLDILLLTDMFSKAKKNNFEFMIIQEIIDDDGVFLKNSKSVTSEIVIPFKKEREFYNSYGNKSNMQRVERLSREKLPLTDWIYLKLYIPNNRQDEFITDYLRNIKLLIDKYQGELFYLRYIEKHSQIRLRIKSDNNLEVFQTIQGELKKAITNNVMVNYEISTYDREIERYGGKQTLEKIENIFCLDSYLNMEIISQNKKGNISLDIKYISVLIPYFYLEYLFDYVTRVEFLEFVSPRTDKFNINKERKKYQEAIERIDELHVLYSENVQNLKNELIELKETLTAYPKEQRFSIVDSIIHVHNNRLVGIDREREREIYYILRSIIISEQYRR